MQELFADNSSIEEQSELRQICSEMIDMEYIYDVIYGRDSRKKLIRPYMSDVGENFAPHIIMTVVFDDFWNYCVNKRNRERQGIKRDMLLCCREALKPDICAVVATLTGTDKLAIALDTGDRKDQEAEKYAMNCAIRIRDYILKKLGYHCSVGVSHYCTYAQDLWYAYEESFNALQQGFFQGNCQVMLYDKPNKRRGKRQFISEVQTAKRELTLALGRDDSNRCKRSVGLLMRALMNEGADMNDVRSTFAITMSNMAEYVIQFGINPIATSEKLIEAVNGITCANTTSEVEEISVRFLFAIIGKKVLMKPHGIEGTIVEAKAYIRQYLSAQLTLEDVAEVFGYHPAYFSRCFRQYAKMSFRQYLNDVRVEKAKKYLETNSLSINEIANKTGFQNSSYFSIVFRKKTGVSPCTWREQTILTSMLANANGGNQIVADHE